MKQEQCNILSIIPARSGSTRIKNKNIRILGHYPLIYYTINASLKSSVSRTIVSTDNPRIARIAKKCGAEVPFLRPKKYTTSKSSSLSVILHCLNYLTKKENYFPDYVVYLQPTSPFRTFHDINKGIEKLVNSDYVSLIGVVEVTQHPFWMFKKSKNDKLFEFITKRNKPKRSQDMPKLYYINDALCITTADYYKTVSKDKPIFDLNGLVGLEMSYLHSFDINTEYDFRVAQYLHKHFVDVDRVK